MPGGGIKGGGIMPLPPPIIPGGRRGRWGIGGGIAPRDGDGPRCGVPRPLPPPPPPTPPPPSPPCGGLAGLSRPWEGEAARCPKPCIPEGGAGGGICPIPTGPNPGGGPPCIPGRCRCCCCSCCCSCCCCPGNGNAPPPFKGGGCGGIHPPPSCCCCICCICCICCMYCHC